MTTRQPSRTPELDQRLQAEPDLVDRIFDYILADPALAAAVKARAEADKTSVAKMKAAVRGEFQGSMVYVAGKPETERRATARKVLALFNGRNATEVARSLGISRASVYRHLKQAGRA